MEKLSLDYELWKVVNDNHQLLSIKNTVELRNDQKRDLNHPSK
jgi:hypothetical protein